ncbi:MAG: Vitamin K epoxide reductase, partial [uncultured Arthrobacter sp.]
GTPRARCSLRHESGRGSRDRTAGAAVRVPPRGRRRHRLARLGAAGTRTARPLRRPGVRHQLRPESVDFLRRGVPDGAGRGVRLPQPADRTRGLRRRDHHGHGAARGRGAAPLVLARPAGRNGPRRGVHALAVVPGAVRHLDPLHLLHGGLGRDDRPDGAPHGAQCRLRGAAGSSADRTAAGRVVVGPGGAAGRGGRGVGVPALRRGPAGL